MTEDELGLRGLLHLIATSFNDKPFITFLPSDKLKKKKCLSSMKSPAVVKAKANVSISFLYHKCFFFISVEYVSGRHSDGDDIQYDEYVDLETGVFHKIPIYDDTAVPPRKKVTGRKRKNSEKRKHSMKKMKGKFLF